jgi:hypothetical protein
VVQVSPGIKQYPICKICEVKRAGIVAQVVRAPAWQVQGPEFIPSTAKKKKKKEEKGNPGSKDSEVYRVPIYPQPVVSQLPPHLPQQEQKYNHQHCN